MDFDLISSKYSRRPKNHLVIIKIYYGLFVADPSNQDLWCQVETMGSKVEQVNEKIQSAHDQSEGLPFFNFDGQSVMFNVNMRKKFNFIRFSLRDSTSLYGQRILDISDLRRGIFFSRKGYRYIPLRDGCNRQLPLGALLVHTDLIKMK
ncbi:hypothetical protein RF11_09551 [Thelohanellus kitauei]|uniref:Uncharacterized protein n=1 Tax=Thelohanellus kitauei TaxID=669202 RepID=A0A0C2MN93_THEKT|nr:hypothetical protein RF11_09551 [Thelohanellus kitauei]